MSFHVPWFLCHMSSFQVKFWCFFVRICSRILEVGERLELILIDNAAMFYDFVMISKMIKYDMII